MKEALEKKSLVTLNLPFDQIVWYKKGKELIINGHLFDVKETKTTSTGITVTGLYDVQEQQLHERFASTLEKDPSGKAARSYAHFLLTFQAVLQPPVTAIKVTSKTIHSDQYFFFYTSVKTTVISPPPQGYFLL
jgi:hypothetical protein